MEKTIKEIENVLKEEVIEIKLCSRLTWRNEVYYCRTRSGEYSVKIYKDANKSKIRSKVEYEMYKMLNDLGFFVPQIFFYEIIDENIFLICKWINGKSLKTIVNEGGVNKNKNKIENFLNRCKLVWTKELDEKLIIILLKNKTEANNTPSMIYTRLNITPEELFDYFKDITKIHKIKKIYEENEKQIKLNKYLINSDFSLHEVIYSNDNDYWIDFETYTLGNINNDIAGIFYSLSNSFINNKTEIEDLFNILKKSEYYKKDEFIFYLIERVLCANYLCGINKKELKFYTDFILDIYK